MSFIPGENIAPPMETNEALRRILFAFFDQNGNPQIGTPMGPLVGSQTLQTRVNATGPLPTPAILLVPARIDRRGLTIRNLDNTNTVWFDSNPNVTDVIVPIGQTLFPGAATVYQWSGAVYIYCIAGSPLVEAAEIYG